MNYVRNPVATFLWLIRNRPVIQFSRKNFFYIEEDWTVFAIEQSATVSCIRDSGIDALVKETERTVNGTAPGEQTLG